MGVDLKCVVGKVLGSVTLSEDKEKIVFRFQDGSEKRYATEGDCCSQSWIEHLETPANVNGAVILEVREDSMEPWDLHKCEPEQVTTENGYAYTRNQCGHDSLAVYHTIFRTDRGDIVLEFRNDSNGYYGGYLVDA